VIFLHWLYSYISRLFSLLRPHCSTAYVDAAYCYRRSSVVCLSVCHDCEPWENGWTDQDDIWVVDSGGSKEAGGVHWRHLVITIEQSLCCGDAAYLSSYFDHLFLQYGDGAGNTVEENSSVFSLIWMRQLPSVLWRCWLGCRKDIWPVKNMGDGGGSRHWLVWME